MMTVCHSCQKEITFEDDEGMVIDPSDNEFHIRCHYQYYEFEKKYDEILDGYDVNEKRTRK